jgi:hypothetical protein
MGSIVETLLSGVYVWLRGRSTVRTVRTRIELTHAHHYKRKDGTGVVLLLCASQFRHEVVFERWYMLTQIKHIYQVDAFPSSTTSDSVPFPTVYFPHLCAQWMHSTTYPHYAAINAYVDTVLPSLETDRMSVGF